jgi:hypothetical protein
MLMQHRCCGATAANGQPEDWLQWRHAASLVIKLLIIIMLPKSAIKLLRDAMRRAVQCRSGCVRINGMVVNMGDSVVLLAKPWQGTA